MNPVGPIRSLWTLYAGAFGHPVLLLVLLLTVMPLLVISYLAKKRPSLRFSDVGLMESAPTRGLQWTRHLPFVLRLAAVLFLIAAFSGPRKEIYSEQAEGEGVSIMIALDISTSMMEPDMGPRFDPRRYRQIPDFAVNRLDAAKQAAERFIDGRTADRIGLVTFARFEKTVCPLTLDHAILKETLRKVTFTPRELDGTAIAPALFRCLQRLKGIEAKSKIVVLITDGSQTIQGYHPVTAAKMAKSLDPPVKIYTIGIGDPGWQGSQPFDEESLQEIAKESGGEYFRAKGKEDMQVIFDRIDQLERSEFEGEIQVYHEEKFAWFALPGLILLLLEGLLANTWLRRLP